MEATFNLIAGVCSLLIFTLPTLIVAFCEWGCRKIYGDDENQCSGIRAIMPYSRELLLYHLLYHPVRYVWQSREFSSTLREKFCRRSRGSSRRMSRRSHLSKMGGTNRDKRDVVVFDETFPQNNPYEIETALHVADL